MRAVKQMVYGLDHADSTPACSLYIFRLSRGEIQAMTWRQLGLASESEQ